VPQFLSPGWVEAFNEAIGPLELATPDASVSLTASSGTFRVLQEVRGVPSPPGAGTGAGAGAVVRTLFVVDGSRARLETVGADAGPDGAPDANVTIVIDYDDAAQMARGELAPAEAVASGRVVVRGDLSVLAAQVELLREAGGRLARLHETTTY
jgi:hypothetical protein